MKDYSTLAKVLVQGRPSDHGQHILKGYPGPELLEVASNPGVPRTGSAGPRINDARLKAEDSLGG